MAKKTLDRVLIIQTAFLGDVILATGLVEKIARHYPDVSLDLMVRKGNESLFQGHPKIRQVIVFEKNRQKIKNLFRIIRTVRSEKYDMVINVQRFFSSGLITVLSGADVTVGFDKNPLSFLFSRKVAHRFDGIHETARNHMLVDWFTDEDPANPVLYPQKMNYDLVSNYVNQKYICIGPASVWFTKQYPVGKWVELISLVPDNTRVYLIGGSGDRTMGEEIRMKSARNDVVNLCGDLDLLDTAALMKSAAMNFVNDSAPMHMASAMNAPVCAVYCSTLPTFGYGPVSDRSFILEISDDLYCRPCGIHGRSACPEKHFRCAYDIRKDQVETILAKLL